MIKSKYWRATDVQGFPAFVLTIAAVTEEIVGRGPRPDTKFFLWFMEHNKGLQINKSRVKLLEYAFGPDSDLWVGKKVRLSFDPTVEFGGRAVGGVKLETPPGAVYQPQPGQGPHPGWGQPPQGSPAAQMQPAHQPGAPAGLLPPKPEPVWNPQTQAWEFPAPASAASQAPAVTAQAAARDPNMWGGAPTLSQRIAQTAPAEWVDTSTGEMRQGEDFNDAIPF
jgi:hypothetical protein